MENYDEAAEEIKNRRKKRALKVFVTEALMVFAVIALVIVTTLIATGYNVKPGKDWTIERTGLVQIQSNPTGANIAIDDEPIFGWTNLSRSMTEGEHEIVLSRDGYESWSKKISVKAGLYYRLSYPRLFLNERKVEELEVIPDGFKISFAKDGNIALLYSNEKSTWKVLEINNEKPKSKDISVKDLFTALPEGETDSGVKIEAWSGNSEKVLVSRNGEWAVIDVKRPEKSVNLLKKYGMKFSEVKIANDAATEFYVISEGSLRKIDFEDEKISSILVHNVNTFDNLKLDLVYIADDDGDGKTSFGVFKNGEAKDVKVDWSVNRDGATDSEEESIFVPDSVKMISFSEYYGDYYLNIISENNEWMILKGERSGGFDASNLNSLFYKKFEKAPTQLEVYGNGELFSVKFDDKTEIFDIEAENVVKITTFLGADWLDEFMIYDISSEGELNVADFDRENQRKMTDNALQGTEVKISKNNRWMYFVSKDNKLSRVIIAE